MKKRKLIFLLPIAAMALGACGKKDDGGSSDPGEQEHEEVTLAIKSKANFELEVEATKQLEAELKGTTGTLVWSSSAEAVATVDQTGKVTAVAVGSATITVSFEGKTDSVQVTVKEHEDEVIHVQSIKKNVSQYSVEIDATATIGATFTPENATDQGLIFELSKEGIVSISEDGTVTGLAEGSVDITVKSHDNPSATFTITGFKVVAPAVEVPTSTASGYQMVESGALTDGDYVQFIAEFGGHIYGMKKYASGNNVKTIELSVSDEVLDDSATDGIFVIVKNDDGTYSFKDSDDKYLDACGGNGSNYLKVTDSIKSTSKFNVTIVDGKATIVCADQNTGRGHLYLNGSATCFSCYADKTGDSGYPLVSLFTKTPVVVHADGVTLDQETLSFEVGDVPKTLVATVSPAEAVNKEVTWSSSAPEVATVVNGVVTALAVGTTTITVTTVDGGLTDTCEVTVTEATRVMTGITIEGLTNTVYTEGDAFDLAGLIVKAVYDKGEPAVITEGFEPSIAAGTLLTTSDTSFTVTYNSLTSNAITLTVNEKQPVVAEGYYRISSVADATTYYLKSNGTNSAPSAVINADDATIFKFTLVGETKDTYEITVAGDKASYLYAGNDNNTLRVGSTKDSWKISEGTIEGTGSFDLVSTNNSRVLSLYNKQDFRSYTTGSNSRKSANVVAAEYREVESISVKQGPDKTTYYVGDSFDPTGIVLTVNYKDGGSGEVNEGFTWAPKTFEAVNEQKDITITYGDAIAHIKVAVIADERVQTGIEFLEGCDMTKKEYKENESWDAAGLAVKDVYDNGDKEDAEGVSFSFNPAAPAVGVTSVTVTATKEGFEPVSKEITGITVSALPKSSAKLEPTTFAGLNGSSYSIDTATANDEISYSVSSMSKTSKDTKFLQFAADVSGIWTNNSNKILKSVSVTYTTAQTTSASNVLSLYARAEAFDQRPVQTDFAGINANGTFAPGQEVNKVEFEQSANVRNFTIFSNAKAAYIDNIQVEWYDDKVTQIIDAVRLSKVELSMHEGDEEALTATVKGLGELGEVTWSSTNEEVATVLGGTVSAVGVGDCKIIATSTKDTNIKAECSINVAAARSFTELSVTGGFKNAYTTDDKDFVEDNLVVYANYDNGDQEPVTDYTVSWVVTKDQDSQTAFIGEVGTYNAVPTIHWDGHDLALSQFSYTVTQAAVAVANYDFTKLVAGKSSYEVKDDTTAANFISGLASCVNSGEQIITGVSGYSKFYTGESKDATTGVKFGTSSVDGKLTLTLSKSVTKVVITVKGWTATDTFKVNDQSFKPGADYIQLTVEFQEAVSSLTIVAGHRALVKSMILY